MQVSVESIGKLERRMQVLVPAQRVSQEIDTRLKTLSRTARLNGFRPGKAPLNVIRRQFGVQVHREVIGELLQSSFSEAVAQNRLAPTGSPRIEPQSMDEGQDLRYVATFEVFPEIVLQPVEGLEIERTVAEVAEPDVDAMIERLRKQQVKFSAVARPARSGDKVTVDFEGSIGGVAFAGGKGENVAITLGEGRMLPELEEGLVGVTAAQAKEIGLTFPADYRAAHLAGQHALFQVSVKSVEEPVVPALDDEFCTAFGVTEGGIPRLREEVTANMRRELDVALRARARAAVLEKLYEANPVDVPNGLVEAQIRELQAEAQRRSGAAEGAPPPPREGFVEAARRRVAIGLLVGELIRREKLRVDPARANARLDEMVGAYGDPAALKRAYQQNPDAMRQVESLTLEDQVVDWILERAKVRDVPSNFRELMKFEA